MCAVGSNIHTTDPRVANYLEAIKANCHAYYANCLKDDETPAKVKQCMKDRVKMKRLPTIDGD
jgi:hypothetical protein